MKNEYQNDGIQFLRRASESVSEEMSVQEIVEATLFLALGIERILKGILFAINPIYIYKLSEFKNTAPILYPHLMTSKVDNKEVSSSPDCDVLTFRQSLSRARVFSPTTAKHVSLLVSLSNYRDIIVHNVISALDIGKAQTLLMRDLYVLLNDYREELNVEPDEIFGSHQRKLVSISITHQDSVKDRLAIKLDFHRRQWEKFSAGNADFVSKMRKRSDYIKNKINDKYETYVEEIECPACKNEALVTIEVDFDYCEGQAIATGVFVSDLQCLYCQLKIDEYDEMDALDLNELISNEASNI